MRNLFKTKKHFAASIFRYSFHLDRLNTNAQLVAFIKAHPARLTGSRQELHKWVYSECCGDQPIEYLEFGVFRGESLAWWLELDKHPDSRFFGFDTFTGLPEDWRTLFRKWPSGTFDTEGDPPILDDRRARFVKGLFQDTLGQFLAEWQPRGTIIVHCDPDLYSSTLFVLTELDPILKTGAIIIFDDFNSSNDVFRAFKDYVSAYRLTFCCLAASDREYKQLAVAVGTKREVVGRRATMKSRRPCPISASDEL